MEKGIMALFLNDYYKILRVLYENQVKIGDDVNFTPLTQLEVAEKVGVSKITMNAMFKELHKYNIIYPYKGKRGMYCLSEDAQIILDEIDKINNYIENRR